MKLLKRVFYSPLNYFFVGSRLSSLRQPFLEAMSRITASVAIVSTDGKAGRAGATVNTLSPVSADEPPSLLICLHRATSICKAIRRNRAFCIHSLRESQQDLAKVFAGNATQYQKNKLDDKFLHGEWRQSENGVWLLKDALVSFDCRLKQAIEWQSHDIILGEVRKIILNSPAKPLLYVNRRYMMLEHSVAETDADAGYDIDTQTNNK